METKEIEGIKNKKNVCDQVLNQEEDERIASARNEKSFKNFTKRYKRLIGITLPIQTSLCSGWEPTDYVSWVVVKSL